MRDNIPRAKRKIRAAGIPYEVSSDDLLPERLEAVMAVIYLIFNKGYSATSGAAPVRGDLCGEALRLGRILSELISVLLGGRRRRSLSRHFDGGSGQPPFNR
jgi:RNA polymerase sigma-70 factor, ECF subfamily